MRADGGEGGVLHGLIEPHLFQRLLKRLLQGLSRVLAGAPRSVFTALEAVGIALAIGVVPGITSVYLGRVYEWEGKLDAAKSEYEKALRVSTGNDGAREGLDRLKDSSSVKRRPATSIVKPPNSPIE